MKKEIFADYLNLEWCNIYLATISILQSNLMQFFSMFQNRQKTNYLIKIQRKWNILFLSDYFKKCENINNDWHSNSDKPRVYIYYYILLLTKIKKTDTNSSKINQVI